MSEVDYIVVGLGLAGVAFCEQCKERGLSVLVYDKGVESASRVAAGLYNPVILKKYSLPWMAAKQFDLAINFYTQLENKLAAKFMRQLPVQKIFQSVEDQNNWFVASSQQGLDRFVKGTLTKNHNTYIEAPFELGEVEETGKIDIPQLLESYRQFLKKDSALKIEAFDYDQIKFHHSYVEYGNYKAKMIVFAEGYGIKNNPYFNQLPLVGNKGEYIYIKAPNLNLNEALKARFFIIPIEKDIYQVGATYNWSKKDWIVTEEARQEIVSKLATFMKSPYEIIRQEAGVRPTTGDRRPLVGVHPKFSQLAIINGLGTRGVMAGPFLAQQLMEHLEDKTPLLPEIAIARFPKKLQ